MNLISGSLRRVLIITQNSIFNSIKRGSFVSISSVSFSYNEEQKMILGPWFNKKVIDPVLEILKRGTEPKELAFSTALGFTLGLFPICGVPVFLCGMAIAVLKSNCHAASMMLANFVSTPVELSLVVPFLRFGETITGGSHFPLTSDALKKVLTGQASQEILISIGHALLGWLVAAPFIFAALYILLLPVFKILVLKFNSGPLSPKLPLNSLTDLKIKVRDV